MEVLVDTSAWSLALRRKGGNLTQAEAEMIAELSELVREGRARMIGLIRQELLSGIRFAEQYENLRIRVQSFPDEPVFTADHEDAAKYTNQGRSKGIAVSVVDALICAVAIKRNWSILTTDPDFSLLTKVLPISIHEQRK